MKHIFCIFLISSLSMSMSRRSPYDVRATAQNTNADFHIVLSEENLSKLEQSDSALQGQICEMRTMEGTNVELGELGCFITNISLSRQHQLFTGTMPINLSALGINDPTSLISKRYIFKTQNNCWFLINNAGFRSQSVNRNVQITITFRTTQPEVNCPDYANTESRESGKGVESDDSNIQVSPSPSRAISN